MLVEGLRLQDSAMWMQHYLGCERVTLRGLHVWNFDNQCNDGLDLDGCRDCVVSECVFESDDDGITLKSTFERPSENIIISDCIVRSHCNAIKMGTESNGGFKDITIANCVVTSPPADVRYSTASAAASAASRWSWWTAAAGTRRHREHRHRSGVTVPLFLRLGDRARPFQAGHATHPASAVSAMWSSTTSSPPMRRTGCSITGLANARSRTSR